MSKTNENPIPASQPAPATSPVEQTPAANGNTPAPALDAATLGQQYRDQLFAQCAMGNHQPKTNFGICGIITAVMCFPCGLICLFKDTDITCARCGVLLEDPKLKEKSKVSTSGV
ncbi:hypothetical protein BDZ97DRAFT_620977 [Flammula alnicola]|nr:hypothetical protein BDZ97DRAFT_620977 [Flammula alnicola]